MSSVDTKKLRERAERYFADDVRGDLDAAQWGEAMPPGDVLFLLDNYERIMRAARIDRRRLADGVEPMVGQRVVIVPERAKEWGIPGHTDHVHVITSLLGDGRDGCGLVECGPTQFNVGMLQLAPDGAEVTCPSCRGWDEQRAKWREDAEVYRREQIGEVHRLRTALQIAESRAAEWATACVKAEDRLRAMTAARDEACNLAERHTIHIQGIGRVVVHAERIAELRKVGKEQP